MTKKKKSPVQKVQSKSKEKRTKNQKPKKKTKTLSKLSRAPIVAVLGHVDHGKTTLLDSIRKTNVQSQETGGITQHIGAYQVNFNKQPITFIDTPGHAAFAKMRQRGAQATDLVILVVAANDGVKPQTKESIRHIQQAKVPLIVAINKMDLPGANADMVKAQLVESGIEVEGYGGDIVAVEIVATKSKGINDLLEMIILTAQLQEVKASSTSSLSAVVIESRTDPKQGPKASVIIKNGTLKVGDQIKTISAQAKVRNLINHQGKPTKIALPGEPVEILGFKSLPQVGEIVVSLSDSIPVQQSTPAKSSPVKPEEANNKDSKKENKKENETEDSDENQEEEEEERPRIKALLKADTQGTLEAIKSNVSEEVEQVGEGIGDVTESDILLAQATGGKILGFRVGVKTEAKKLAEVENVEIKHYQAIYELLEDLEKQVLKALEPTIDEEVLGTAEVVAEFKINKTAIAGCKIKTGKLELGGPIHLIRGDKIIKSGVIRSLKQNQKDVKVAKKGEECGISFKPSLDFKTGDKVQYYRTIEV